MIVVMDCGFGENKGVIIFSLIFKICFYRVIFKKLVVN
jgi:hypothetical protein